MSNSINFSQLLAAQAASFAKGKEVNDKNSKEALEQDREKTQAVLLGKQIERQNKTNDPEKGFLA